MALDPLHFGNLDEDIQSWMARSDLGTNIVSIIRLAEQEVYRRVRLMEMEADLTLSCPAPDYEADLPDDFIGFRRVTAVGTNPETKYVPPDLFATLNFVPAPDYQNLLGGAAMFYTIESMKVKVHRQAGATSPVELDCCYFRRFVWDGVSDATSTNIVLQTHYHLYLYAGLMVAWEFVDEPDQETKYEGKLDRLVGRLDEFERRRRIPSSAPLQRTGSQRPLR